MSTKVLITQPYFELQTSDFAWQFIRDVEPNDKVRRVHKQAELWSRVQPLKNIGDRRCQF